MSTREYKYIVVPVDQYTNEVIAAHLNATAALSGNETIFEYKQKEKRGYYIPHQFITQLKKSTDKRLKYELFEKVGGGMVKPYSIPGKKSAAIKKVAKDLKSIKNRS